jgi:soluble lytic murein transglycosylase-like protein
MSFLLAILAGLFTATPEGDALRSTDPTDLTAESATEHLANARIAAAEFNVDPALLLSIAYHESRYDQSARTAEPGNKVSCGVMTPVPGATCTNGSLLEGYRAGAAHLREWIDAMHGNERQALLGYAGGYALIKACAEGPVMKMRKGGHSDDICLTPDVFWYRARWIKRALDKVTNS